MAKQKAVVQEVNFEKLKMLGLLLENPFPKDPQVPEKATWTASSLKTFRKCPRLYFWKYIMRLKPRKKAMALAIGIVVHSAIGKWYAGRKTSMKAIATATVKKLEDELHETQALYGQEDFDKFTAAVATLRGMLNGYALNYGEDRKKWSLKRDMVERKFEIDFGIFKFAGKIDLVTKKVKSNILVEHKTAANIGESYIDRLPMDTQVRAYILGSELAMGIQIGKVLYDIIRKCKLRRKKNESAAQFDERIELDYAARPSFYFYREPLLFNRDSIEAFKFEMYQTHLAYKQVLTSVDPNDPRSWLPNDSACNEYFTLCPFHTLCLDGLCRGHEIKFEQKTEEHEELADE